MLYGHRIAGELERWWAAHAGNPNDEEWRKYLVDYANLLTGKFGELTTEHVNVGADGRKRFGMSKAGGCTREAGLKLLGYEEEPHSGSTQVTFYLGHLCELIAIASLRAAGYEVDGAQEPVRIDPLMASFSDGIIASLDGKPAILSVKSSAYKMSGQQRGKWLRRGFTELPFEGVRKAQPSWWAQAQAEMHGSGIEQTLVLAVSKDIVKVFEEDEYMQRNGSLTFYSEVLEYDPVWCAHELLPIWQQSWDAVTDGRAPTAFVYNSESHKYNRLPKPADDGARWGGPNRFATGTFNPCFGCSVVAGCKKELAREFRR
ncbi:MAG: hypothetical protein KGL39_51760 [Patescibacteria group bacterium]|nr:hypothetical protein [Patescibacteria group bacterium]